MTADRRHLVRSPLAMRLIAGFVAVAVVAVFVLAGLTLWRTKHSVGQLARERQQATADAIAGTLELAYQQSGGWDTTDPHPAMMLASRVVPYHEHPGWGQRTIQHQLGQEGVGSTCEHGALANPGGRPRRINAA